jgi:hypothetical protein
MTCDTDCVGSAHDDAAVLTSGLPCAGWLLASCSCRNRLSFTDACTAGAPCRHTQTHILAFMSRCAVTLDRLTSTACLHVQHEPDGAASCVTCSEVGTKSSASRRPVASPPAMLRRRLAAAWLRVHGLLRPDPESTQSRQEVHSTKSAVRMRASAGFNTIRRCRIHTAPSIHNLLRTWRTGLAEVAAQ